MNTEHQDVNKDFEERLRMAMRRVDAPETMAQFMQAAAEAQAERLLPRKERKRKWAFYLPRPQFAGWMTGAVAAVLAVGVFVGGQAYKRHERSVEATQQFETATRITDEALAHTRAQLQRAGIPLN
jgi:hypothetical protein